MTQMVKIGAPRRGGIRNGSGRGAIARERGHVRHGLETNLVAFISLYDMQKNNEIKKQK